MKLILLITDVVETLDSATVRRLELSVAHVRISESGELLKPKSEAPFGDWRCAYQKWALRLFPNAWVYRGGHHIAVHASPPKDRSKCWQLAQPGDHHGQAGHCLFRIVEVKKLRKLHCGIHFGNGDGGRCWKCDHGFTDRQLATALDRNLVAAVADEVTRL
jgi:hypothetical protein